jgi:chromosome segregation ATPase
MSNNNHPKCEDDTPCDCVNCEILQGTGPTTCIRYNSVDRSKTRVAVIATELTKLEKNYARVISYANTRNDQQEAVILRKANQLAKLLTVIECAQQTNKLTNIRQELANAQQQLSATRAEFKEFKATARRHKADADANIKKLNAKNQMLYQRYAEIKKTQPEINEGAPPPNYEE